MHKSDIPHCGTERAKKRPKPRVMQVTLKLATFEMMQLRTIAVHEDRPMSEIIGAGLCAIGSEGWEAWRRRRGFADLNRVRSVRRNRGQNLKLTVDEEDILRLLKEGEGIPKGMVIGMIILSTWLELPPPVRGALMAA